LALELAAVDHKDWLKHLLWSKNTVAAAKEANQLIEFLREIAVVLTNPSPEKVLQVPMLTHVDVQLFELTWRLCLC